MSDNVWSSFTLYFDGSHKIQANTYKAGGGCIIRDSQGKVVIAAAFNLTETFPEYCNVAIVEAAALWSGLQLAKDNNLKLNLIKGDNKEVIDHVEGRSRRPSKSPLLSGIIQQIIGMIDRSSVKAELINREDNKPADKLASIGSSMQGDKQIIQYPPADLPPQVIELVKQDMIDRSSVKAVLINREANKPANKLASIGSSMDYGGRQIFRTPADLPPQVTELVKQHMIDRSSVKAVLINREANKPADKLASIGSSMDYGGRKIFRTPADLPPQVTELVKQDMSYGSSSEAEDKGEGSSMAETIGMAGAAVLVAGKVLAVLVAMIAWGIILKLMSGESSSDQKYVLHFNGSDINQYGKGAGCIIRNNKGELFKAAAYNLDNLNANPKQFHVAIAGAMAWLNGMKLAKQNNVKLHLIKGKNEEVINRVLGRQTSLPEVQFLSELIDKIKMALVEHSIDPESQVELIGEGEGNEVAYELANYGSNGLQFGTAEIYTCAEDLPRNINQLLQQDKMNWRA